MSDEIEICTKWIKNKNAHLIAVDNKVVWWESLTGKARDEDWQKISPAELLRILTFTEMDTITIRHIITSFQECDEVYELSANSHSETPKNVFNYMSKIPTTREEIVGEILVGYIDDIGFKGLFWAQIVAIYQRIIKGQGLRRVNKFQTKKILNRYFTIRSYTVCDKVGRMLINGKLQIVVIHRAAIHEHKSIVELTSTAQSRMIKKVTNLIELNKQGEEL